MYLLTIGPAGLASLDILGKGSHHFQLGKRGLVNSSHAVVDEVRGQQQRNGEDFGIIISILDQTVSALRVYITPLVPKKKT